VFITAAGPRPRSHYRVRVLRDSWPHFTVSDSRISKPGGPGPRIYIHREQGGLIIPPGIGFSFRRLLRLAGLRWRYSNLPLRGLLTNFSYWSSTIWSQRGAHRKHRFQQFLCCCVLIRCFLTMTASARSTVPASSLHLTVLRFSGS
jgi:hypothetical protein